MLVFGKLQPVSNITNKSNSSHALARSDCPEGVRFRAETAKRETARQAFVKVDNNQACRRALLQRNRPNRGRYQPGDWVMMWRENKRSIGPMKVIQQDGDVSGPYLGTMFRGAPEQVRPLTALEEITQHADDSPPNHDQMAVEKPPESYVKIIPGVGIPAADVPPVVNPETQPSSHRDSTEPEPSTGSPSIANTEDLQAEGPEEGPAGIPDPEDDDDDDDGDGDDDDDDGDDDDDDDDDDYDNDDGYDNDDDDDDDDGDDLFCEALRVSSDQRWSMEIDLAFSDVMKMYQAQEQDHVALLTSAAKKQRSEVKLKDLISAERTLFEKAKEKELQSWLDTGTIQRICRGQIPKENVLRCRWLLTWKETNDDQQHPTKSPKARLIVLGYEDPQLCNLDAVQTGQNAFAKVLC